ncbi:antitoxin Xre-like helix-turn-helix domain-containing protein [Alishewanella sp. HL-SH05]|uniref:antitoxin Xre-like helix-turn-helix domain-containing protein n=1 Tax=Alishewanella sp. HL-SH05 TaxID=3461145 RepID=UPI004041DCA5
MWLALRLRNNILDKWGCTDTQKQSILGLSQSTFNRYQKDLSRVKLSGEQLERLSYLANIHKALRIVFTNPKNIYGFMSMANDNPYFDGQSPLSIIATGDLGAMYEVSKHIDCIRNA